ncbi:hypothetical protein F5882DRAFT_369451 [Hyaloscypha sp. PMI_1271]|nr:hypothetical protein F5882DRAFT_369451 [Hyaloscypha sp. PMI_1271]
MSAISKLTAAFASATNEFTLAAANFSIDFSLMKVEAPIEFHGLGRGLSERRRTEAESGSAHITARKLGALFNDVAPPTPELVKAYGRRVSEIADTPEVNPRGQGTMVFGNHVGADGTSIWAAATSGSGALQIQLLTCMLARVWDGPEAISVWVELVKERKEDIAKQCEDGHEVPYGAVMATRQEISRDQLAEWDASARAWLRTADQAKLLQQKQLMLVIDNVEVPVNHDMRVYSSVIAAWKTALQALENLVIGMPQSLHQEGSILLALSAWHLYPDLLILKESIKRVQFKDDLIASSGTLTLGMFKDGDSGQQGVYWSLSLAHLRYYGDPVVRTQAITRESSRITFLQLMQVALGGLTASWSKTYAPVNALELAEWFVSLGALFDTVKADDQLLRPESIWENLPDWLHMLVKASRSAVEAKGREHEVVVKLFNVGQKHGSEFLVTEQDSSYIDPFFGLLDLEKLLPMLKGLEQRLWLLRQIAERLRLDSDQIIIRYFAPGQEESSTQRSQYYRPIPSHIEYATAIPRTEQTSGQQYPVSENMRLVHKRWVTREFCDNTEASRLYSARIEAIRKGGEEIILKGNDPLDTQTMGSHKVSADILDHEFASGALQATKNSWDRYDYLFGDTKTAAIYVLRGSPTQKTWQAKKHTVVGNPDLLSYFKTLGNKQTSKLPVLASGPMLIPSISMSQQERSSLVNEWTEAAPQRFLSSLKALVAASKVYEPFPHTTIAIGIIRKPVYKRQWASEISEKPEISQLSPGITQAPLDNVLAPLSGTQSGRIPANVLSRAATFSCLTLFESGHCDVNPHALKEVMALSSGDSIYVATPLLCDPIEMKSPHEMRRVIGNVGRPGITMLVPPANPLIRKVGPENWNVVTHASYDGKREDSFQGTTLHLSFTGYNPPIVIGEHGAQDSEVFILESLVSVHDHGKWVADLNVLEALGSKTLARINGTPVEICPHKTEELPRIALTAIDSWEEFLDLPSKPSVVRACGNWVARLSLAATGIRQRSGTKAGRILLCGDKFCWKCFEDSQISVGQNDVFIQ